MSKKGKIMSRIKEIEESNPNKKRKPIKEHSPESYWDVGISCYFS